MVRKRYSNWWFMTLNGIIGILFGLLMLFFTDKVIEKLVFFFGLLVLLSGIAMLLTGIINMNKGRKAGLLLFESIITIAIGTIIMFYPQHSLQFFMIVIGVWAVILGIVQLVILFNTRVQVSGKNVFLVNGLLTMGIGFLLFFDPFSLAGFIIILIGVCSLIFGCLLVYLSFVLRKSIAPDYR